MVEFLSDWMHVSVYHFKAKQSLATLTKVVPKRHSVAMPTEAVVNGNNQEWVMQADLPLTAAIRQSQQTLYVHPGHPTDRQGRPTGAQVTASSCTWTEPHGVVVPSFTLCMLMWSCFLHIKSCHLLSMMLFQLCRVMCFLRLWQWWQLRFSCMLSTVCVSVNHFLAGPLFIKRELY